MITEEHLVRKVILFNIATLDGFFADLRGGIDSPRLGAPTLIRSSR
jgi:hypothetical protein